MRDEVNANERRRSKRARNNHAHAFALTRSHPYGIQPFGNLIAADTAINSRNTGLGALAQFNDELVLTILRYLCPTTLSSLMQCSRGAYVFSHDEELWKYITLKSPAAESLHFYINWKWTYALAAIQAAQKRRALTNDDAKDIHDEELGDKAEFVIDQCVSVGALRVSNFYSDDMFHSFYCSAVDLTAFDGADTIERVSAKGLSKEDFVKRFGISNRPVVITDLVNEWPAYHKWTVRTLIDRYPHTRFKVGALTMTMKQYFDYAQHSHDETPLYLFDSAFGEKAPDMLQDYSVPQYFEDDLFETLSSLRAAPGYNDGCEDRGEELQSSMSDAQVDWGTMRPSYRWILMGPQRSGSTFHKDPNQTSAWNGLISGRKKWLLYPPDQTPPGVFPSADGRDVVTPISISEWFVNYYAEHQKILRERETRRRRQRQSSSSTLDDTSAADGSTDLEAPNPHDYTDCGPVEVSCVAGDCLFIPNGWWHCALNLEESIAVTQNFVNAQNVLSTIDFLSGDGNTILRDAFIERLNAQMPTFLDRMRVKESDLHSATQRRESASATKKQKIHRPSLWELIQ